MVHRHASSYLTELSTRPVHERVTADELRSALGGPLPDAGEDPAKVVEELADAAEPGVIALASPRYFGFVIGGAMPAAMGADWLATAWDQIGSLYVCGPSASVAEEVAGGWVAGPGRACPTTSGFGLTTGGHHGQLRGHRLGTARRARAGGLGRRGARAAGRARASGSSSASTPTRRSSWR